MRFIADLHIHSRYSRATSSDMSPESIWKWAQLKGITVAGTGDFTHPGWIRELEEKLEPADNGLLVLKKEYEPGGVPRSCRAGVFFVPSVEISCIYKKGGRTRKVHNLVFAPDLETATHISRALDRVGNLNSDGRPILGLDSKDLLKIVLDSAPGALFVPAHAWTPHFSVFGAASGFDSLEECFEELTPHVRAIETGLSSDPPMNRRLSALDGINLISNSDAHSPARMGREANIFDTEVSCDSLMKGIATGEGLTGTIEFFPEEGKYHYDGHRSCGVCLSPRETLRRNYLCPVCGKKLTVGVMHRVWKLADRDGCSGLMDPDYRSLIPLIEIVAEVRKMGANSKAVGRDYLNLLESLGNEFGILMDLPTGEIAAAGFPGVADAIGKIRRGDISVSPGFDGEYGKIRALGEFATRARSKAGRCCFSRDYS
ncbi:MAG: endonuclease Q family protein [Candidatus Sulfobium sp.]|jgi:uncharacterized protein (TIGR00375 family)